MKKLMMLAGLALAGVAGAQSWDIEDMGKLTLVGCYGKQDGVYCDFSFVLTKKQTGKYSWRTAWFKIFKQDGTSQFANKVTFIDDKYNDTWGISSEREIIANVPVRVQVYFNIPSSTPSFRAIVFNDIKFDNIPIRPFGKAPSTPAPLPTPNVSGFSIALSGCNLQGQNYVCTAVLTPTK